MITYAWCCTVHPLLAPSDSVRALKCCAPEMNLERKLESNLENDVVLNRALTFLAIFLILAYRIPRTKLLVQNRARSSEVGATHVNLTF